MPLTLTTTTAPTSEPLLLAEAKDHCRISGVDDDAVVQAYVTAARQHVENFTNRQLMRATLKLQLDEFPGSYEDHHHGYMFQSRGVDTIKLPRPPAVSVSSITYIDTGGTTQTLSSALYKVDASSEPGRVVPAYGQCWPSTRCEINAVAVTYLAGYATVDALKAALPAVRHAMLLLVGDFYENRESRASEKVATTVENLLWPHRILELA